MLRKNVENEVFGSINKVIADIKKLVGHSPQMIKTRKIGS